MKDYEVVGKSVERKDGRVKVTGKASVLCLDHARRRRVAGMLHRQDALGKVQKIRHAWYPSVHRQHDDP